MTTVEALKDLYVALGGELADVQDMSTNVAVLNAISAKYSGASNAVLNPEAVANIAAVADQIGGGGTGDFNKLTMTVIGDSGSFNIMPNNAEAADSVTCAMFYNGKFVNGVTIDSGNTAECTVLYVGDSTTVVPYSVVKSITGDATYDQETGLITATGDFTVAGFIAD